MLKISQWYTFLGNYTFPTSFIKMTQEQRELFLALDTDFSTKDLRQHPPLQKLEDDCQNAINHFPLKSFVGLDSCSANDINNFSQRRGHSVAFSALHMLKESRKVQEALKNGEDSLIFRPYRRMNKTREFRLFIKDQKLVGVSQYCLERHFRRLEGYKKLFLEIADNFIEKISTLLPKEPLVIDIYLTRKKEVLVIDFNPWGKPTSPLLFRSWQHQWKEQPEIRLMLPPKTLKGDIKVTY